MNISRLALFIFCPLSTLALGGCAQRNEAGQTNSPLLQNMARAWLTGQVYDRATIALRNGNEAELQSAQDDLQVVAPLLASEQAVRTAILLDSRALLTKNRVTANTLRQDAAQKYREALAIDANFPSRDPELLNALGYFLAERGTQASDFKTAETLTRRSLTMWNDLVLEVDKVSLPGSNQLLALRRLMRANTRDSLAWALFRQGKFIEAQKEQEAAVDEAARCAPQIKQEVPADLYYHLGMIYRASHKPMEAEKQFAKALHIDPQHALTLRAHSLQTFSTPKHHEPTPFPSR